MEPKLSVFAEGLDHPEGLAVHPDGSIWCGGEAGQIYRIGPMGTKVEEVARTVALCSASPFHRMSNIWRCVIRSARQSFD